MRDGEEGLAVDPIPVPVPALAALEPFFAPPAAAAAAADNDDDDTGFVLFPLLLLLLRVLLFVLFLLVLLLLLLLVIALDGTFPLKPVPLFLPIHIPLSRGIVKLVAVVAVVVVAELPPALVLVLVLVVVGPPRDIMLSALLPPGDGDRFGPGRANPAASPVPVEEDADAEEVGGSGAKP